LNLLRRVRARAGAVYRAGRAALRRSAAAFIGRGPDDHYRQRLRQELATFGDCLDVNALPAIFHYWSHRYVRPMLEEAGASNPDQFFARYLIRSAALCEMEVPVFVSIGAGNCDTEVRVARLLRDGGLERFTIECLDINPAMLERGMALARDEGVAAHIVPLTGDFNDWRPQRKYAGIMANQSLHHVLALERLFDTVRSALAPKARFVVSDMIGRNGHMRWPEALEAVHAFWRELPDSYRYNQALKRHEPVYENWDCSKEGFEGIRAQDILPLLLERFDFEVFIAFGNVIDVFVDRNFGHNFDADAVWDRDFIDRVHAFDEAGLASGTLTPTHMLAVLATGPVESPLLSRGLDPRRCVRRPAHR
jgi:SAM-dependent methyltransferase